MSLSGNLRRSGTGLVYGNSISAPNYNLHMMSPTVFREDGAGWLVGPANGTSIWDINDTSDQTGNGYGGGPGGLYASGTATRGSGKLNLTVSGTPWMVNQWAGYMVTNLDQYDSKGFIVSAYVLSNTANAMTFAFDDSTASPLTFNIGNRFEIWRVLTALDQPGRGRGDLCTGGAVGGFHNTVGSDGWAQAAL